MPKPISTLSSRTPYNAALEVGDPIVETPAGASSSSLLFKVGAVKSSAHHMLFRVGVLHDPARAYVVPSVVAAAAARGAPAPPPQRSATMRFDLLNTVVEMRAPQRVALVEL
jgi:hypothetical protein